MEVKPFGGLSSDDKLHISQKERQDWGFAFSYASRSSKSILVALQWLHRFSPYDPFGWLGVGTNWIVSEMVEWLKVCTGIILIRGFLTSIGKNQTADSEMQDELITWMEAACTKVERVAEERRDQERKIRAEWEHALSQSRTYH